MVIVEKVIGFTLSPTHSVKGMMSVWQFNTGSFKCGFICCAFKSGDASNNAFFLIIVLFVLS
jgi:hypothetical protein